MTCHYCKSIAKKHGRTKQGLQRFRCPFCKKAFCEDHERPLDKMRIKLEDAVFALKCLVEGNSVRSTERMTGLHRDTILDLLLLAGERCEALMEEKIRNVPVKQVQADEIWGYVGKKEKHKSFSESSNPFLGDAYTFVAIEANTKLILCFELGRRDWPTTISFVKRLANAVTGRFQLTTDGFKPYVGAVEDTFGADVDFSQLVKLYTSDESTRERYSPGEVVSTIPVPIKWRSRSGGRQHILREAKPHYANDDSKAN
jgi:transposase-like protein